MTKNIVIPSDGGTEIIAAAKAVCLLRKLVKLDGLIKKAKGGASIDYAFDEIR